MAKASAGSPYFTGERSIDQGALDNAWENDALSGDYTLEELAELYPGM